MKLLIAYATTEGQTRKVCKTIAGQVAGLGHQVELLDMSQKRLNVHPDDFDAFIVAASVHQDRHQNEIEVFVAASRQVLSAKPAMFISVSLAAAIEEKIPDANNYVADFIDRTGWTPAHSLTVAGAVRSDEYDYFQQQILEHVVFRDRDDFRVNEAQEFTDWAELGKAVEKFVTSH